MRNLATIRKITEIKRIEGADNIELAVVDGWQCVIKKNIFHVGDNVVYHEIDSLLPPTKEYEFLEKGGRKKMADGSEGYLLKTRKMLGNLSQGLVLPISDFEILKNKELNINDNVTELLNIKLYEPPINASLAGDAKGNFPFFIPKTDQERIQNLTDWFEKFKDVEFEVSIKMDGSSMTCFFNNSEFGVCSRNLQLKETENNTFWKLVKQYELQDKLTKLNRNIAIQGEACGEGIQKNNDKIKGHNLFIFDIYDIDNKRKLLYNERIDIIKQLNAIGEIHLDHVPVIGIFKVFQKYSTMESILEYANGHSLNMLYKREGIVCKSNELLYNNVISFKVISNEYLLKN